jgi:hypothetical protein
MKQSVPKSRDYERWIVLPDLQIPYQDKRTLKALEAYIADVQKSDDPFVGWLQMGDFLDFDELSRWNQGYEASIKGNVYRSFVAGNEFLDRHQELMGSSGVPYEMVLLQGNHDYRTVDFARREPKFKDLVDYQRNLKLRDRQIKFVKCWENHDIFTKGRAKFIHGNFLNKYHAFKHVDNYGTIFYGHTHDVMEFPKMNWGKDKTYVGKSLGCLCIYNMPYMKTKPSNWQQAFSEFYFFKDGFFQEMTTKIYKHRFVGRNGIVYQG